MKDEIYAKNVINRAVDEFILTIAENYESTYLPKLTFKKYIDLTRDRVLKQLKQLEKESGDEWND